MGVILQVYRAVTVTKSQNLTQLRYQFESWKKTSLGNYGTHYPLGFIDWIYIVCESGNYNLLPQVSDADKVPLEEDA